MRERAGWCRITTASGSTKGTGTETVAEGTTITTGITTGAGTIATTTAGIGTNQLASACLAAFDRN